MSNESEVILDVRGVKKHFGGIVAVKGVSLSLSRGDVVGIIGANGAGKSTLLAIAAGLLRPDEGSVLLHGQEISWTRPNRMYRAPENIGYLAQDSKIVSRLGAAANIVIAFEPGIGRSFWRIFLSSSRQRLQQEFSDAEAWLEEVIPGKMRHLAGSLSVGQKRILELLRFRAGKPAIVFCDEPTAGLHHDSISRLISFIQSLKTMRTTVLLTEHNLAFVAQVCERCVVMKEGGIWGEILPRTLAHHVSQPAVELELQEPSQVRSRFQEPILEVTDLRGGYNTGISVFSQLSFSMRAKEVIGFTGPNGSGKSSALKAIANLLPWRTGRVTFPGIPNPALGIPEGIALMLQEKAVFPHLTVLENLLVAADKIRSRSDRLILIEELCGDQLKIPRKWWGRRASELSGGERRKVALAMALVIKPRLLLLDEPTSSLSSLAIDDIVHILTDYVTSVAGIILVEHNLDVLTALGAQIISFDVSR
jgi:ABC-type multidrug transport system ATPase subunit